MRTPKDRLHRVLVIGATPAGIAATNKLGEMGIPVTLVDSDPDLNGRLSAEEWRLKSGLTLNHALRPGLLRILRNPRIRCILPGKVTSLKHTPQGFSARFESYRTFVDPERCTLCGKCTEACPVSSSDGSKPIHFGGRQSIPGRPVIEKRRQPLCQANCPLGVNVQGYMALAKVGKFAEALELIRRDNILPGVCGRVCTHPCESSCRRGDLDDPLAIRDIKRFVADYQAEKDDSSHVSPKAPTPGLPLSKRVAVIGSGPAGLAAAADLARMGYEVTVFEKESMPGGLLRYGIGPHRLPRDILNREIEYIKGLGVRFELSHAVDLAGGLADLKKDYSAVIVANGIWKDRMLEAPGEDLGGVEGCVSLLEQIYRGDVRGIAGKVAIIGDGNAAFDLARVLVRIGAQVTIVSWFPKDLIPADPEEVRGAIEEGIPIVDCAQVTAFLGSNGKLESLRCARTKPGEPDANGIPWPVIIPEENPFELHFDHAIIAIGQRGDPRAYGTDSEFHISPSGLLQVDATRRTNIEGIYAAGDTVSGPSSVVQAMASGRDVARAVHRDLSGEESSFEKTQRPAARELSEITPDIPSLARSKMPERQPVARISSFAEVALGLSEAQVLSESARCLQCGVCSECLECADACPAGSIKHDDTSPDEDTEQTGVVIIADPHAAPPIKGEDVIRAYSTKTARNDVYGMMLRGFAAAAEAMILLGERSHRLRGHGVSFTPPDPQLSKDIRLGVFICRCNDVFGWPSAIDDYIAGLAGRSDVACAETINSACTPESSASIVRAIRERGLTRVVLASCVCCPLDLICGACTDQRSRLKDGLFNGTGISRAMVETCNLRGEVLRLLGTDSDLAVGRFIGLIERSLGRARRLKTLPSPARPYNFTTAVIGDSEAAIKSAVTLAESGMEVLLFRTEEVDLPKRDRLPNIHSFDNCVVKGLRGTVGNFQVIVEINGAEQVVHVGAVILGEQSRKRIPYMPMADLPSRTIESSMQERAVTGIPFFLPGATSVPGLFLANPAGISVSGRVAGAAAAVHAISVMPRRPRQNKGYTVVVDENRCRGCGRCISVCPYQAVSFRTNSVGGWCSVVDEALCKGCGNCISVCPSNAADSPYRDRRYLEQMIDEILL